VIKLLIGILKGSILGVLIGYGAFALGATGTLAWLTYGIVGALVGLVVGRPIWSVLADKNATSFASILKAVVGFGIGIGLYALANKFASGIQISLSFLSDQARALPQWQPIMGAAIGGVWGGIIELDDAFDDPPPAKPAAKKLDKAG
jgi:hypothetical protein